LDNAYIRGFLVAERLYPVSELFPVPLLLSICLKYRYLPTVYIFILRQVSAFLVSMHSHLVTLLRLVKLKKDRKTYAFYYAV